MTIIFYFTVHKNIPKDNNLQTTTERDIETFFFYVIVLKKREERKKYILYIIKGIENLIFEK